MDELIILGVPSLAILVGSVFGWISFFHLRKLSEEVRKLRLQLDATQIISAEPIAEAESKADSESEPIPAPDPISIPEPVTSPQYSYLQKPESSVLMISIKQNWMSWLGGLCIALGGVFLARYSIQMGLLGPTGKIISGIATGFSLHFAAEYLRRKTAENHLSFTMLAGGGSITIFATLLAALNFYQMFSPMVVFILLAIVATVTMWLARIHGPALAAMGMVGAYIVPLLVSTGSVKILAAMAFSLIVSTSILFLMRYVYRYWLWIGLLAGGLLWWALSLNYGIADGWRGLYLALFAYGLISIVPGDWALKSSNTLSPCDNPLSIFNKVNEQQERLLPLSLLLICIAQCITIFIESSPTPNLFNLCPLAVVILLISNRQEKLTSLPWVLYLGQLVSLLAINVSHGTDFYIKEISSLYQVDYFIFLSSTSILFSVLARRNFYSSQFKSWWSSLVILAPLFAIIVSYLLGGSYTEEWLWSLNTMLFGAVYIFLATRGNFKQWDEAWTIWLFLAGNFAYTFSVVILLDNAGLTLALAIQAISVASIIKRFNVPDLGWLLKVVVMLVAARLTVNPWLADYPMTMHWTIWTYGGATLCCFVTSRILSELPKLARWAEAGSLHLLVLTLWVETRYFLYEGVVFSDEFTFLEAAINVSLFGAMALLYSYKKQGGGSFEKIYSIYSKILLLLAAGNYGVILQQTFESRIWLWKSISETPIWNLLLLAYLMPAIIAYLCYKYFDPQFKKPSAIAALIAAFVFVNLEIRHLWTGSINLNMTASDGELYTYSAIWMLLAISAILSGSWRFGKRCYQAGMLLLAMVILKVFFIDMSQLDGIYRIVAFMGLGLSLLGIAYLHKRIGNGVFDRINGVRVD